MSITKITTPELLDFPKDSTSSVNTSGTVIPTGYTNACNFPTSSSPFFSPKSVATAAPTTTGVFGFVNNAITSSCRLFASTASFCSLVTFFNVNPSGMSTCGITRHLFLFLQGMPRQFE